ncbi:hypothetical protein H6771_00910 [Candidatus Peribacteria bacterium]|nr:hypothetical protein [Candidatus Peribacteria bacterium]
MRTVWRRLQQQNYLAAIRNSLGSRQYQDVWLENDTQCVNVTEAGIISCAWYASSLLVLHGVLQSVHGTVEGTEWELRERCDLLPAPYSALQPGDILLWEAVHFPNGGRHAHIGFFVGEEQAISNSARTRVPALHHWTYEGTRAITAVYRPRWEQPQSR